MTASASVLKEDQTQKGSKVCLFIMTQTHNMQIFGESPLSSHKTTLKQQINEKERKKRKKKKERQTYLFLSELLSLVQCQKCAYYVSVS